MGRRNVWRNIPVQSEVQRVVGVSESFLVHETNGIKTETFPTDRRVNPSGKESSQAT